MSVAEFLKNRPATKTGPFYEVDRVLSAECKRKFEYCD